MILNSLEPHPKITEGRGWREGGVAGSEKGCVTVYSSQFGFSSLLSPAILSPAILSPAIMAEHFIPRVDVLSDGELEPTTPAPPTFREEW